MEILPDSQAVLKEDCEITPYFPLSSVSGLVHHSHNRSFFFLILPGRSESFIAVAFP